MTWKKPHSRQSPTFQAYHGTHTKFDVPDIDLSKCKDIGFHAGNLAQATKFAEGSKSDPTDMGYIIPLEVTLNNPIRMTDYGAWKPIDVWARLVSAGLVSDPDGSFEESLHRFPDRSSQAAIVRDRLLSLGYDGIVYLNRYEGFKPGNWKKVMRAEIDSAGYLTDAEVLEIAPEAHDSYIAFKPCQLKRVSRQSSKTSRYDLPKPNLKACKFLDKRLSDNNIVNAQTDFDTAVGLHSLFISPAGKIYGRLGWSHSVLAEQTDGVGSMQDMGFLRTYISPDNDLAFHVVTAPTRQQLELMQRFVDRLPDHKLWIGVLHNGRVDRYDSIDEFKEVLR